MLEFETVVLLCDRPIERRNRRSGEHTGKGEMSRSAATFRQHDATRALRAVTAAGMVAGRVEIDAVTGKIVIQLGSGERVEPSNALDKWIPHCSAAAPAPPTEFPK